MKKVFIAIATAAALTLAGCDDGKKKAEAEKAASEKAAAEKAAADKASTEPPGQNPPINSERCIGLHLPPQERRDERRADRAVLCQESPPLAR